MLSAGSDTDGPQTQTPNRHHLKKPKSSNESVYDEAALSHIEQLRQKARRTLAILQNQKQRLDVYHQINEYIGDIIHSILIAEPDQKKVISQFSTLINHLTANHH